MSKTRTIFACQNCGYQSPKWLGRCPECGEWNSFAEETFQHPKAKGGQRISIPAGEIKKLSEIQMENFQRVRVGIEEFDNVLGKGIVPSSFTLIGGDPGVGKSTLLLQVAGKLAGGGKKVLYVSGEESISQIKMRADRLNINSDNLFVLSETVLENIISAVNSIKPFLLIVDSIQTIFTEDVSSAPGTVSQVRECAGKLMMLAKGSGITTFVIGHVTKEGAIAGPRVLEHIVDTVLYFEGDTERNFRILRSHKNRFGSVSEIGVFKMTSSGLEEVKNPSEFLLSERTENVSGSVVICALEGVRPLLMEVQALVSPTPFGVPRRNSIGIDPYRVNLLIAIMEKRLGISFLGYDVFLNVAGGIRVSEPAADLGVILALYSSIKNIPVNYRTVCFGEVGLAGEVRNVVLAEERIREIERLGFHRVIMPLQELVKKDDHGIEIRQVRYISEAMKLIFKDESTFT